MCWLVPPAIKDQVHHHNSVLSHHKCHALGVYSVVYIYRIGFTV